VIDLLAAIFLAYNYGKIDVLASFNHHRSMKAGRLLRSLPPG